MAKLTPKAPANTNNTVTRTTNEAGGAAYTLSFKDRLVHRVMTSLFSEPAFYGDQTDQMVEDARQLCLDGRGEFVLQTAVYARQMMYLRTTPVALLGIFALYADGPYEQFEKAVLAVCTRPDQLQELVGYINQYNDKLPRKLHALRRAIAKRLTEFDAYQFGKYNSKPHTVKLASLIHLSHPKPKDDEQAVLFKSVLDNRVTPPETWEVKYSAAKDNEQKRKVWTMLMAEGKLPYMAALRNLMNMIRCGVGLDFAHEVGKYIANPENVAKSKQWPYRYYSAYRMLRNEGSTEAPLFMKYVSEALDASAVNFDDLGGVTFMSADNSGSMDQTVSDKSNMSCFEVGNLFQALMFKKLGPGRAIASVFGKDFKIVNGDPNASALTVADQFKNTYVGHNTNGHLAVEYLLRTKTKVDRIIIFTDCQLWVDRSVQRETPSWRDYGNSLLGNSEALFLSAFNQYRTEVNPNVWLHWVNLAGYGTLPVPMSAHRINVVSGFGANILKYFSAVERGEAAMVKEIEKTTVDGYTIMGVDMARIKSRKVTE